MTAANKALNTVAIIPARGGSKRLPGKNKRLLGGKPLIQWTLEAARDSGVIDLIVVTSDDEEVLAIARANWAMAIKRPDALASDTATTVDTVLHALQHLTDNGFAYERIMLLQPTSPLRRAAHIREALARMSDTNAASVISVCETEHSPLLSNTLPPDGSLDGFIRPEAKGLRSQDLPTYYRLNGAIYFITRDAFFNYRAFDPPSAFALIMEPSASVDIDTAADLRLAEFFLTADL
ncbi:acylneuraminate cytidylyltransferase family protein [Salinisphaera hydrothermalis]|uniref:acylneuraminate cytidylyltransferase family protein n=1 Tax=Salinisphaera hydrothermalis TaxID=563188 RepID=UPI00333E718C